MLGGVKDGKAYRHHVGKPAGRLEVIADMEAQFEPPGARGCRRQDRRVGSPVRIGAGFVGRVGGWSACRFPP